MKKKHNKQILTAPVIPLTEDEKLKNAPKGFRDEIETVAALLIMCGVLFVFIWIANTI